MAMISWYVLEDRLVGAVAMSVVAHALSRKSYFATAIPRQINGGILFHSSVKCSGQFDTNPRIRTGFGRMKLVRNLDRNCFSEFIFSTDNLQVFIEYHNTEFRLNIRDETTQYIWPIISVGSR